MLVTYPAILRDGKLEWGADGPPPLSAVAVPVHVTILAAAPAARGSGEAMFAALEAAAAAGAADVFGDPLEWQRQERIDRVMPGRDE